VLLMYGAGGHMPGSAAGSRMSQYVSEDRASALMLSTTQNALVVQPNGTSVVNLRMQWHQFTKHTIIRRSKRVACTTLCATTMLKQGRVHSGLIGPKASTLKAVQA
jgi:hypothetical protein